MPNSELHNTHRVGWLRAAVLGANDGIVSTASLVLGVAAEIRRQGMVKINEMTPANGETVRSRGGQILL